MFHKCKYKSHVRNVFWPHGFVAERHLDSYNIIWMYSIFHKKIQHSNDIAIVCVDVFLQQIYVIHVWFYAYGT